MPREPQRRRSVEKSSPDPEPEEEKARDRHDELLDRELEKMDQLTVRATLDLEQGMGSYVKSYARSVLPFAIGLGAFRALQGGSLSAVLAAVLGGTLLAGFVSFVFRTLYSASRRSDEAQAKRESEARAAKARPIEPKHDAHLDARLDDELDKLD